MGKILLLAQPMNLGGLTNYMNRLVSVLEDELDIDLQEYSPELDLIKYDVIHLFFGPFKIIYLPLLIKLLFLKNIYKKKVLITYYNLKSESGLKFYLRLFFLNIFASGIVVPSEHMQSIYKRHFTKTFVVYPPIDRSLSKIKKINKYFAYVGALRPDKGIDRLVFLDKLLKKHFKTNLHIFPIHTKETPQLHGYLKDLKLHKEVEIKKIFPNIAFAFFPYHNLESTIDYPLAVLDCISSGILVLTTEFAPLNDILPKETLIKDKYWSSEEYIVDKIKRLLRKKSNILQLYEKVVKRFDKKSILKQYKSVLNST